MPKKTRLYQKGEASMNVRKLIDYSVMYATLDTLIAADLPQMELYCKTGELVSTRPKKDAAVAAAECLAKTYPDVSGFFPRDLRRMRNFYRAYQNTPEILVKAMAIGWAQNIVILENCEAVEERVWYIRAVRQFGWTKVKLLKEIAARTHKKAPLDIETAMCYTGTENRKIERIFYDEDTFCLPRQYL